MFLIEANKTFIKIVQMMQIEKCLKKELKLIILIIKEIIIYQAQ
jgi:hypothetical protein